MISFRMGGIPQLFVLIDFGGEHDPLVTLPFSRSLPVSLFVWSVFSRSSLLDNKHTFSPLLEAEILLISYIV